ncbi:syntaxin-binding protein 5 isoform X15 [Sitodiplosis mosellana]|uniref:syntaxin-binding protein 5 isoform X15 n=1 Tax=Sitodiplosis mosellana TaxID=263140 RepID=UPI002444E819|nr:syntaxin-binding protein 5 isoform X15 [Sitodiplosis mosellana]XP_055303982.1 syntaxin-binding protein 5 isoform X15 [Sitodiplosis mosellana]XP_055303983.1 syntaxin-binding protein 5 isoform X15 [Sitodiplosis mosellana]XP_055303984.1 syntaxin-binding protein 5 isoform X15 [Sitodiplosis mosellana]XP_055303985.1 syntaxin-binding protein 5 isoform X15 [Sitodiplosis mosellana]
MKKFTFKGVLDGFRQQVQPQMVKPEQEIPETLRPEHFQLKKTFRHGFPHSPTALGYDPVQKLLAIGDKSGSLRVLGKPGVDCHVRHEGESACAVTHIQFLVNEGALITVTADDMLHLWNFRQKSPQVVQSLKFQRERITCLYLPVAAKWLYVGTDKGNIHVINIESFALSGYIINWNKAIEVLRKDRPGAVVSLSDNPTDTNKLLIAYESGTIVLWDLRGKCAEMRWQSTEQLRSVGWHHEGKYFVSSHTDGSLCTWPLRPTPKPQFHSYPHAKTNKDGKLETCKPIHKVDLRTTKMGETFTIFSGGLSVERDGKSPCITVLQGRSTTVLEMEHPVVDFITICESPWSSDMQEPYAIAVLLQNDLVLIDLLTPGFPCFESPYPMDIHESPVTCCTYLADCPSDLVPAFYMVGLNPNNRKAGLSDRQWPISGGGWSPSSCSYFEIIITGHQDGSIKFWDSSAGTLQILYKLKTAKIFDRPRTRSMDGSDDDPLAIQMISLCAESRRLCVAGASGHVILFKFRKAESVSEYLVLEIPISYENFDDPEGSPECEFIPRSLPKQPDSVDTKNDGMLKVRPGPQRKPAGFQAQLVCLTPWTNGTHPGQITALCINSNYGLMAYGTEYGLVIVDIVQKICLLNIASPDLYGAQDPYARTPRSPKRTDATTSRDEQARSPSIDQDSESDLDDQNCLKSLFGEFFDKLDSSFSRSRSSSMSSLENISTESVTCLAFADSYTKKSDPSTLLPTLWVGTSLGSVLTISITLPDADARKIQPVLPTIMGGSLFRLKGSILSMSFLDCNGALIPYSYEPWKDENRGGDASRRDRTPTKQGSNRMSPTLGASSSSGSTDSFGDRQFIAITSEKTARVIALPSQNCVYRQQIADTDYVVKAEVISLKDSVCLICYISTGHLIAYSLPSLRQLMDVDFLPLADLRISKTFCFSNRGHGLYLATPTEIQKFTVCDEFCQFMNEMIGELFSPVDMPEPPKESFFKGLFGGGARNLDREELFGESGSGKPNRSVAKHIPGPNLQELGSRASTAASEISRAHQLAMERGEKLSQLEDRAERMSNQAQEFSGTAHSLMQKYKDKKWYQL